MTLLLFGEQDSKKYGSADPKQLICTNINNIIPFKDAFILFPSMQWVMELYKEKEICEIYESAFLNIIVIGYIDENDYAYIDVIKVSNGKVTTIPLLKQTKNSRLDYVLKFREIPYCGTFAKGNLILVIGMNTQVYVIDSATADTGVLGDFQIKVSATETRSVCNVVDCSMIHSRLMFLTDNDIKEDPYTIPANFYQIYTYFSKIGSYLDFLETPANLLNAFSLAINIANNNAVPYNLKIENNLIFIQTNKGLYIMKQYDDVRTTIQKGNCYVYLEDNAPCMGWKSDIPNNDIRYPWCSKLLLFEGAIFWATNNGIKRKMAREVLYSDYERMSATAPTISRPVNNIKDIFYNSYLNIIIALTLDNKIFFYGKPVAISAEVYIYPKYSAFLNDGAYISHIASDKYAVVVVPDGSKHLMTLAKEDKSSACIGVMREFKIKIPVDSTFVPQPLSIVFDDNDQLDGTECLYLKDGAGKGTWLLLTQDEENSSKYNSLYEIQYQDIDLNNAEIFPIVCYNMDVHAPYPSNYYRWEGTINNERVLINKNPNGDTLFEYDRLIDIIYDLDMVFSIHSLTGSIKLLNTAKITDADRECKLDMLISSDMDNIIILEPAQSHLDSTSNSEYSLISFAFMYNYISNVSTINIRANANNMLYADDYPEIFELKQII